MEYKRGQRVYTVNAKTGKVDPWNYDGIFTIADETIVHLVKGKKQCYLPIRCVFPSKEKALEVANMRAQ